MLRFVRNYTTANVSKYSLTCGLEIHAQLMTQNKLFSNSKTSFHADPNSQVSYYDAALPGTQPKFNWKALLLALKAAAALDCTVADKFSFDRKHYFYGDQPAGYQITQHYEPYAKSGILKLYERDGVKSDLAVRIKQIQIEQDTGKTSYIDNTANIDLNRTNHGLIELVTEPDIPTPEAAGVFVKKLQMLLRHIGVCSGELESGAMRVDVNVSVNGGQRCEIKNLSSISAIVHAIRAEFQRQKRDIQGGGTIQSETRGWDGVNTWKLRGKEEGVDYRYMPDPELQPIAVSEGTLDAVRNTLPELPDVIFKKLLTEPYSVPLKDARTIMSIPGMVDYYTGLYTYLVDHGSNRPQIASNWLIHRFYGELNTQERDFDPSILSFAKLGDIILMVQQDKLTATSGSLLLRHLISSPSSSSIAELVDELELGKVGNATGSKDAASNASIGEEQLAIQELCTQVIDAHPDVANQIRSGKKPKSIMFLVGQVMKECQGRIGAQVARDTLEKLITKSG